MLPDRDSPVEAPRTTSTFEFYTVYRDYVVHENDLINQRVSWFIQLHSFLIATYGIVVAAILASFFNDKAPTVLPIFPHAVACLILGAISVIGIASSKAARRSIKAADRAIKHLRDRWDLHESTINGGSGFPRLIGGGDERNAKLGASFHMSLPRTIIKLWWVSFVVPLAFFASSLAATLAPHAANSATQVDLYAIEQVIDGEPAETGTGTLPPSHAPSQPTAPPKPVSPAACR